jgi:lipopolysaccharide export LptBFGC system permease protein LptF
MEAPEVPTEHLHEHMHEHAHASKKSWIMWVALSSALLAGLAAVTSLLAGHHANEAMVEQIKASDQWSYYQAKGVKANVLASKMELLQALGKTPDDKDARKLGEYKKEQEDISSEARAKEIEAKHHLESHVIFARGVTLFQVAIAIGAISVLTHRRRYWIVSLIFGLGGVFFLGQGLIVAGSSPAHGVGHPTTAAAPEKPAGH